MMSSKNAIGSTMVSRRSPLVAVLLSGLFPGLGQLYNREKAKALLMLVLGAVTGFAPLGGVDISLDPDQAAAGLLKLALASLPFFAVAAWSIVDAYRVARKGP